MFNVKKSENRGDFRSFFYTKLELSGKNIKFVGKKWLIKLPFAHRKVRAHEGGDG